jgi:hypothetical protein
VLAPSGSGTGCTEWKQRRVSSACNAHPTRVGGGVTGGRLRANNMASNRHAPGLWRWKASRLLQARPPSREGARVRSRLAQEEREESPAPRNTRSRRPWGARAASEEGNLKPPRHAAFACEARGGPSLQAARPTQSSVVVHPVFGATGGGLASSPASGGTKCDDLRRSHLSACLQRREANVVEADVARCPLVPEGMGCRMPCLFERGSAGSAGRTRRASGSKRAERSRRARIGRSKRLCSRVGCSLQKSIGGVGLREACALHFTRSRERTGTGV